MKIILIMILTGYNTIPSSIESVQFQSVVACEIAKQKFMQIKRGDPYAFCVEDK